MERKIILEKEKDDFTFTRVKKNEYEITFTIQNNFIHLPSIINFDLLNLLYELNKDIFERITLDKINEHSAITSLLMKHFFVDLGLSQKYAYFHIEKKETNKETNKEPNKETNKEKYYINFNSKTIFAEKPEIIPDEASLVPFQDMNFSVKVETSHKVNVFCSIILQENQDIPFFIEKFMSQIMYKIFNRLKQFIEKQFIEKQFIEKQFIEKQFIEKQFIDK